MAIGPIHYDFELRKGKEFHGKLIFDVRYSQKVDFELHIESLNCQMNNPMKLDKYFYNYMLTVYL